MAYETITLKGYINYVEPDASQIFQADTKREWIPGGLKLNGYINYTEPDESQIFKADTQREWVPGGLKLNGYINYTKPDESRIFKADTQREWVHGGLRLNGYINYTEPDESQIFQADTARFVFVTLANMSAKLTILLAVEQPYGIPWMQTEIVHSAWCWKVTRQDGVVLGFTSHGEDIEYGGVIYKAETGFAPTAVQTGNDMSVDDLDAQGLLSDDSLTAEDLRAGKYDNAGIEVFLVNYQNLKDEILMIRRGYLGEVTYGKNGFTAEVRGLMDAYQQAAGKTCQKGCRTHLGSELCKVNLSEYTHQGQITGINEDGSYNTTLRQSNAYFNYGLLTFDNGDNAGLSAEIKNYAAGKIELFLPTVYDVAIGDTFTAVAGCDGNASTCRSRFGNLVNFRGEPYVMGNTYVASYPSSSSKNIVSEGSDVRLGTYKW